MFTTIIDSSAEFASLQTEWNELAGSNPFKSWEWQFSWWQTFSDLGILQLIACHDNDQLVGIAPFYLEKNTRQRRILRLLATGKACSEYLGFLCEPQDTNRVQRAVAEILNDAIDHPNESWDRIEFDSIYDGALDTFLQTLEQGRSRILHRASMPCWRLALPSTWDEYYRSLSSNRRRKTRTLFRKMVETGKATLETQRSRDEVDRAFEYFSLMHQKRRAHLGGDNCFDTQGIRDFLALASSRLAEKTQARKGYGCMRFDQLMIDGDCAAVFFGMEQNGEFYLYQSGIDPDFHKYSPGWLLNSLVIKDCIENGFKSFDLLRGDEPYKSHLGLRPNPVSQYVVSAPKPIAILRHTVDVAKECIKSWRGA